MPRLRLMANVLQQLRRRRAYIDFITTVQHSAPREAHLALEIERLSRTWMLVDNLLGVYTVVANQMNLRTTAARFQVARLVSQEVETPPPSFFDRVWLYEALREGILSGEIRVRDVTPVEYMSSLQPLLDRTIGRLTARYAAQRRFRQRYEALAMSHRHGRVAFQLAITSRQDVETVNISFDPTTDRVIAIRPSVDEAGTTVVDELTADDAYHDEIENVLEITTGDIENYAHVISAIETAAPGFLEMLEHGSTRRPGPRPPWILLAAPYDEEELRVATGFTEGS